MLTRLRTAAALLTVAAGLGLWLFVAPFVVEYQAAGAAWLQATTDQVVTGAALAGAALLAVLVLVGGLVRMLADAQPDRVPTD